MNGEIFSDDDDDVNYVPLPKHNKRAASSSTTTTTAAHHRHRASAAYGGHNHDASDVHAFSDQTSTHLSRADLDAIQSQMHGELLQISQLLQKRNDALARQEADLAQREASTERERVARERELDQLEAAMKAQGARQLAEASAAAQHSAAEEHAQHVATLTKECRRQHDLIAELRAANQQLRDKAAAQEQQLQQCRTQLQLANGRVRNLKRDAELHARKGHATTAPPPIKPRDAPAEASTQDRSGRAPISSAALLAVMEVAGGLFDGCSTPFFELQRSTVDETQCLRLVPALCDILAAVTPQQPRLAVQCLQFTHMCLRLLSAPETRAAARTSLRRIGEVVCGGPLSKDSALLHVEDPVLRVLAALIVVQTLNQGAQILHRTFFLMPFTPPLPRSGRDGPGIRRPPR